MSGQLKDVLKKYNKPYNPQVSMEQHRVRQSQPAQDVYVGEWQEDRRHGWGVFTMQKTGDRYKGQFEKDLMEGRGIYKFSPTNHIHPHCTYYIGEVKSNLFHGLGRLVFRDGTQYFGSFNNNVMQSGRALIKYGNGDTYKGGVAQNQKADDRGEAAYTYANGD